MVRQFGGDSLDRAEIIIDYKKKKIDIINPFTKKIFKSGFIPPLLSILIFSIIVVFIVIILIFSTSLAITLFIIELIFYILFYEIYLLFPSIANYYHLLEQRFLNDYLVDKKLVIVKKLKNKIYKLPYEFANDKLDYKCYKDFSKYLLKIHIFPKDYYIKYKNKIEKQLSEWEAWFYFSKIPKTGRMEIEFV